MPASVSLAITIGLFVLDLTIRVLAVVFVPKNRRPATAMAWLLTIFFVPYLGVLVFLLLQRNLNEGLTAGAVK